MIVAAPCRCCHRETPHEPIASVQSGLDFWRCLACGTVEHTPKTSNKDPKS